ncbi:unnamed protein product [Rotaria magnacalcarata]|uniref:BRCT domain-containing protein n=6 Tax=Rotaria magnacalcarata TaxID=392030 RepID=A0A816GST9_9BILA|nr:unnamed protein product [Rotaria magnacalcarata]CAF1678401.1 unnamed protein product [Rotaria magnacalcarata]
MSQYNDIAGSDDVISLNFETQETLTEHSYRTKQSTNRIDKSTPVKGYRNVLCLDQAKENKKPIEQVNDEEIDGMQTDAQRPASAVDTQNNPFMIRPTTLTDESRGDTSQINEEKSTPTAKSDAHVSVLDASTVVNNLHLYISPSTSLLETTNEDVQPNPANISGVDIEEKNGNDVMPLIELNDKPKNEPMDTSDAQASFGSDGIIDSHPTSALTIQVPGPMKAAILPASKVLYSLSQPATNKFESILAKLATSPERKVTRVVHGNDNEANITTREEEELFIRESISKIVRRYAVKIDQHGRTMSRELLTERTVEENTTTRIESWPPEENKNRRSTSKTIRKKSTKPDTPKQKTKPLKPTSTVTSPKISKPAQNDDEDSTGDDEEDDDDDEIPTDDVNGDEFIPPTKTSTRQSLTKGSRIFAKWVDGHFYPGVIGNVSGEKYMIEFDDGAKRYVKGNDIISQSYLEVNQNVLAQTQDGYFERGIVKNIIKKKKTGKLGYIVEKDGKQKWYPLRFVSLTHEQAEHISTIDNNTESVVQGKRKRMSTLPQSPNKKTKSSIFASPNRSQRSTYTPSRPAKLFNTMYFLLTGFNDSIDIRHKVQDSIESHGGKVIEKMPSANRRDNVYLISDMARKTAKFIDAKKFNTPCVNYKWINESIEKSEIQDWELYALVLPEKANKTNNDSLDDNKED